MSGNDFKIGLTNPKICLVSYLDLPCSNFPQGIASISAMLKREGYSVTVLDFDLKKLKMNSEGITDIPVGIEDFDVSDFDVICFSLIAGNSLPFSLYHIERIKSSTNKIVMAGGPVVATVSETGEKVLNETKTDFICVGEGEEVMINFMNALKEKSQEEFYDKLSSFSGLGYKHNGKIVISPAATIGDLDNLPMPDYEAFDMETYLGHKTDFGDRHIDLFTSRGCPFSCKFCFHAFAKRWKSQSAIKIVENLKYLKEHYNIKSVSFRDDNFTHSKDRTLEFCKLVKPLDIKWTCLGRADRCMDEHLVAEMKDSGCVYVRMGLETGSDRMLKVMSKGHTLEHSWNAVKAFTKVGMPVRTSFIIGMPSETIEDAKETLRFMKKIYKYCPDTVMWSYFYTPLPDTPWYNLAVQKGMKEYTIKDFSVGMDRFEHIMPFNLSNMTDKQVRRMLLKAGILSMYYTDFRKKGGLKRLGKFIINPKTIKGVFNRLFEQISLLKRAA